MLISNEAEASVVFDDELLLAPEDDLNSTSSQVEGTWGVLIVDDEPAVHDVTRLALERFTFEEKSIHFVSAYSATEAKAYLQDNSDVAVVLLDVVMEKQDSGLQVVEFVRQELQNRLVRIVLRTGQPGEAPEESVLINYDINDYVLKVEMTKRRITTTMIAALRSYRDLHTIEQSRQELAELNEQLRHEIAERKKLEQVRLERERLRFENEFLEKQAAELTKLNQQKDKFFSIVAHDLKAPFAPLLGFAEILNDPEDELPEGERNRIWQQVYQVVRTIYNLLEHLLEWSRLQMGRIKYNPEPVILAYLVDQNYSLLRQNISCKYLTLENRLDYNAYVYADVRMVNTVLRNLLTNAIKFTPEHGAITVDSRFVPATPEHEAHVEISVTDTGIGISPENIGKLFQIDQHYTTSGTNQEPGSGLGLIICQEMVEKNQGRIWVESTLHEGSSFKFTLPPYKR